MKLRALCALLLLAFPVAGRPADVEADKLKLLALHEQFKAAQVRGDAETLMQRVADDYVRVARGEVSHPRREEMAARMQDQVGHDGRRLDLPGVRAPGRLEVDRSSEEAPPGKDEA